MKVRNNKEFCICSTNIEGINNKEMRQMHEMKERITQVLNSHKDEKVKNDYLTDDELKFMHAILHVFTKEYSQTQTSAFDDFLKEQDKPAEQPQKQEEDETLIKGGPGGYPVDEPIFGESKKF